MEDAREYLQQAFPALQESELAELYDIGLRFAGGVKASS
jgi:hypothetical protein